MILFGLCYAYSILDVIYVFPFVCILRYETNVNLLKKYRCSRIPCIKDVLRCLMLLRKQDLLSLVGLLIRFLTMLSEINKLVLQFVLSFK